ncbi:FecR family protein [Chitinophaga sp.]|uniref:FecR family protein n=1 Tax=Chitinophaga sp. TaxID=1869181 RepID=UPI00262A3107|nr:FecR family protein [uncultured Chitinophaga sp.]
MEDQAQYLRELLAKPDWTDDERRWLLHYLEHTPATELKTLLLEAFRERDIAVPDPALQERLLAGIHARMQPERETIVTSMRRSHRWRVAAAIGGMAILLGGGALLLRQPQGQQATVADLAKAHNVEPNGDIAPGGNKAQLVLHNGQTVVLDQTADGRIGEGNVEKKDAELLYEENEGDRGSNILITPRGGQYRVRLADGTKVWLNAASRLEYPVAFNGKERLVSLTGEAYFEVASDVQRPFFVMVDGMKVQVLGTKFNVNAYPEEKLFTTALLEGAVRITGSGKHVTLKPGQESAFSPKSGSLKQYDGDMESAVAWKNGIITFKNDELSAVMRDLGRWYDVDVAYEPGLDSHIHVTGAMRKQEHLSQALKILELTAGVHFEVEGRTVKVSR